MDSKSTTKLYLPTPIPPGFEQYHEAIPHASASPSPLRPARRPARGQQCNRQGVLLKLAASRRHLANQSHLSSQTTTRLICCGLDHADKTTPQRLSASTCGDNLRSSVKRCSFTTFQLTTAFQNSTQTSCPAPSPRRRRAGGSTKKHSQETQAPRQRRSCVCGLKKRERSFGRRRHNQARLGCPGRPSCSALDPKRHSRLYTRVEALVSHR